MDGEKWRVGTTTSTCIDMCMRKDQESVKIHRLTKDEEVGDGEDDE